jgi:hypothetical protein
MPTGFLGLHSSDCVLGQLGSLTPSQLGDDDGCGNNSWDKL